MIKDYFTKINLLLKNHGSDVNVLYNIKRLNKKFIKIIRKRNKTMIGGESLKHSIETIQKVTQDMGEYSNTINAIRERLDILLRKYNGKDSKITELLIELKKMFNSMVTMLEF